METLLISILDLAGTAAFAASGALLALRRRLDFFGVLVLSFLTACGGGIVRDLLIGRTPPAALEDYTYVIVAVSTGFITFAFYRIISRVHRLLEIFDAIGLGLFTVTGVTIGLEHEIPPFAAALLGVITAVGGGAIRDVLAARVPTVLRDEIYASASLAGAVIMLAFELTPIINREIAGLIGGSFVTLLRLAAYRWSWRLPVRSID